MCGLGAAGWMMMLVLAANPSPAAAASPSTAPAGTRGAAVAATETGDEAGLTTEELRARAEHWKDLYAARLRQEDAAKSSLRRTVDRFLRSLPLTAIAWVWFTVGFVGQFVFGMRFVVQWIASERRKQSVVPVAFWYLSLVGTIILLAYAIHREDWVFIAGFSLNMLIYVRNLYFIYHKPVAAEARGGT